MTALEPLCCGNVGEDTELVRWRPPEGEPDDERSVVERDEPAVKEARGCSCWCCGRGMLADLKGSEEEDADDEDDDEGWEGSFEAGIGSS